MGAYAALIFGSVDYGQWAFLESLRQQHPFVICADGGLRRAQAAGFSPDCYIGDGDSGGSPPQGIPARVLPVCKDLSDLQAAWQEGYAMGFRRFYLTACTGGRQDHHIAALQLLEAMANHGCEGTILDPENEISFLQPGSTVIAGGGFRYFSLLPVDRKIVVSISGARYPLERRTVCRGDSLCVSNEFAAPSAAVTLHEGCCNLVLSQRL